MKMTQAEFLVLGYVIPKWLEGAILVRSGELLFIEKHGVLFDANQFCIENVAMYEARKYANAN